MIANPPYQLFPDLADDQYQDLKRDIAERGVMVPVEYDDEGNILDGHHRVRAHSELVDAGAELAPYPRIVREGWTETQKREHVRRLNILRRHLTQEQRRELIRDQVRETPERSNRQIAGALGVDHKTVAPIRAELEGRGEIPHVSTTTDTLGRQQPVHRVVPVPNGHDSSVIAPDDPVESPEAPAAQSLSNPKPEPLPHMPAAKPPLNLETIAIERDDDGSVARSRLLHQYSSGIAAACSLVLLDGRAVADALSRERRPIHRENARALRAWLDTVEQEMDRIESRPLQIVGGARG